MEYKKAQPAGGERACVLCKGADPAQVTALDDLIPAGRSRFIAVTKHLVAVPTFGCFVPGYLLIVPRTHVLAFGQLPAAALEETRALVDDLATRLHVIYRLPILAFEYGLASPGLRRIEHAHWHLLPSVADLAGWLGRRLDGQTLGSLADLPADHSYIAVRSQDKILRVYSAGRDGDEARRTHERIRLRRAVAMLDPRIDDANWDWAEHRRADLIAATVTDLATSPATR
ncbi:hypothetical protein ACFY4C_37285 [Actinomadura viridis]|uniref:hypothetical protein n=1 Tax=Actinomadura viridis TaxID=58110 RepID=UPI00367FC9CA